MRVRLVDRKEIGLDHEVIWGSIGITLGAMALLVPFDVLAMRCAFKAMFGLPCLTCGMTRSWMHLRRLDLFGAFFFNPLMTVFYIFAALYCAYALVAVVFRTRRIRIEVTHRWEPKAIRVGVVAVALANWIYLIAARI